jgi:hypothetical protein
MLTQVLDSSISHQQAISILQKARGRVELVVARGPELQEGQDSVLPSDWCQVEVRNTYNCLKRGKY